MKAQANEVEESAESAPDSLHRPGCRRAVRFVFWAGVAVGLSAAAIAVHELETSRFQSDHFSKIAAKATFELAAGSSDSLRFPKAILIEPASSMSAPGEVASEG